MDDGMIEKSLSNPQPHEHDDLQTQLSPLVEPQSSTFHTPDTWQGFQRRLDLSSVGTSSTSDNLLTSPKSLIRELQTHAPQGMRYVVTLVPDEDETSFEAVIKARGGPSTSATQPQKRHRISMHGAVLTDEKFLEQQKNKEKEEDTGSRRE
ncbi:hypothetical protein Pcinc_019692 [Petrolisthes cinctipes]|uniref:Uncharacterized protein n=1 Tax=Petrolisthes cinctipes TaxID=88211 RepID=A0AAE1FL15_PETCI|nr:hypothetical protein Pcinc_019692 [Petrolisthes cinctipes]